MSGFGLSAAFFSLLAHTLFPGDISAFLLILAIGTATPMLLGLLTVKLVPLPLTSSGTLDGATIEGYDPIPSGDTLVFTGDAQLTLGSEADTEADADSAPFLSHEQQPSLYQLPPSAAELNIPVRERGVEDQDVLPDIHGKRLWLTPDFHLVFVIMGICG